MKIFNEFTILFIKFYQISLARLFPHKCAFTPSCSYYSIIAIRRFGVFKGIFYGLKRICRCNYKNCGKVDLVPQNIKGDYKWLM